MDFSINIKSLEISANVGVSNEEREIKQPILIDIDLEYHCQKSVTCDLLIDSVDYGSLVRTISEYVSSTSFSLLESVCCGIIAVLIDLYPQIIRCKISVQKPNRSRMLSCAAICVSTQYENP